MKNNARKIAVTFWVCVLLMWGLLRMVQAEPIIPTFIIRHYTVAENSPVGTDVGDPVAVESTVEGAILRYSIGVTNARTNDYRFFSIDAGTAQLRTAAVFDYETVTYEDPQERGFELSINVTEDSDNDGNIDFTRGGYTTVYIKVTDVDENPPLVWADGSSATREVAENTPTDTPIGMPVSATGGTGSLTYSLTGTDAASFDIDSATGQLKTKVPLDYENKNSYTVQVSVTDTASQTDSITVTINVTDVDEPVDPPPDVDPPVVNQPTVNQPTVPTPEPKPKEVLVIHQSQCGLGWAPQSQYQHQAEQPKVMIYALEFEFTDGNYTCSAIEIRTGDATFSHLDGWQLYLGTHYNPSRVPITLTQENSQITDQILKLTPESLGQQTFACRTLYLSGRPLPSVQYDLRNENNIHIDRAYSCYRWGQIALTPERQISPRRISSQSLQAMDPPRIERYLSDPTKVFGTYIDFSAFDWDRAVLSDWLLAASEASEVGGGNAPSSPYKQLTTSWGALKLRKTDRRHKRR